MKIFGHWSENKLLYERKRGFITFYDIKQESGSLMWAAKRPKVIQETLFPVRQDVKKLNLGLTNMRGVLKRSNPNGWKMFKCSNLKFGTFFARLLASPSAQTTRTFSCARMPDVWERQKVLGNHFDDRLSEWLKLLHIQEFIRWMFFRHSLCACLIKYKNMLFLMCILKFSAHLGVFCVISKKKKIALKHMNGNSEWLNRYLPTLTLTNIGQNWKPFQKNGASFSLILHWWI